MKKISIFVLVLAVFNSSASLVSAKSNPILPVNEPVVTNISTNSAQVSVSPEMLNTLSLEQKAAIYFEYFETQQMCIMIYPTPENCLPKKTSKGKSSAIVENLKPDTNYSVFYKSDSTIACITTPCPGNEIMSGTTEFRTQKMGIGLIYFGNNLRVGSRGSDVVMLQNTLRQKGYFLNSISSGYFGVVTLKSVKAFQRSENIIPTGYVGPKTRAALNNTNNISVNTEQFFEGFIQSVSTACFADGECSVTIDGKKVVTTIGWSQAVVGSIKGSVSSIGDIETSKIGSKAKVYAKKTSDGYTLYGNADYYIEVM